MDTLRNLPGVFVIFDGCDGAGKSTGVRQLKQLLEEFSIKCIITREPGGSYVSEKIREVMVTNYEEEELDPISTLLLMSASRNHHFKTTIYPKLKDGYVVISDRWFDSTEVYQGIVCNLSKEVFCIKNFMGMGFLKERPEFSVLFDVDSDVSLERLNKRYGDSNRWDDLSIKIKNDINLAWKSRISQVQVERPNDLFIVDANKSLEHVSKQLELISRKIIERVNSKKSLQSI